MLESLCSLNLSFHLLCYETWTSINTYLGEPGSVRAQFSPIFFFLLNPKNVRHFPILTLISWEVFQFWLKLNSDILSHSTIFNGPVAYYTVVVIDIFFSSIACDADNGGGLPQLVLRLLKQPMLDHDDVLCPGWNSWGRAAGRIHKSHGYTNIAGNIALAGLEPMMPCTPSKLFSAWTKDYFQCMSGILYDGNNCRRLCLRCLWCWQWRRWWQWWQRLILRHLERLLLDHDDVVCTGLNGWGGAAGRNWKSLGRWGQTFVVWGGCCDWEGWLQGPWGLEGRALVLLMLGMQRVCLRCGVKELEINM